MIGRPVANFEKVVLTPLNLLLPIAALLYLIQRAWLIGAFLVFAWFCIGLIGQSIHKNKTPEELARGGLTEDRNIRPDSDPLRDSIELVKPLMRASLLIAFTVGVLLVHHGFQWFFAVCIGAAVGILQPVAVAYFCAGPKK